jgi:hypothetical protein
VSGCRPARDLHVPRQLAYGSTTLPTPGASRRWSCRAVTLR